MLVLGTRHDAEQQRAEVAAVLSEIGLRPNDDKTRVVHIDEGFDFLAFPYQTGPETRQQVRPTSTPTPPRSRSPRSTGEDKGHRSPDHQPKPQNTYYGNSTRY